VVSPDPLSPVLSTSPATKTPENTEEDADNPEPADEGDIQNDYSSELLCSPRYSSRNKKLLVRT